jgi:hypothetical protein
VGVRRPGCIGLALAGRPIRSLVTEDRSAEGAHDLTARTSMLTTCSRDRVTQAGTVRDSYQWEGAKTGLDGPVMETRWTPRNGTQMTHNPEWKPAAAPPSRLAHEAVVTEDGPHPAAELEPCGQVRAPSFSPAVPPACHKQRSRAVCSGQSRSLEAGRWAGLRRPDLGWGRRPKLHGMQVLIGWLERDPRWRLFVGHARRGVSYLQPGLAPDRGQGVWTARPPVRPVLGLRRRWRNRSAR